MPKRDGAVVLRRQIQPRPRMHGENVSDSDCEHVGVEQNAAMHAHNKGQRGTECAWHQPIA